MKLFLFFLLIVTFPYSVILTSEESSSDKIYSPPLKSSQNINNNDQDQYKKGGPSGLLRQCWKKILSDKDSKVKIKDNNSMLKFLSKQVNDFKDILYGKKVNTNEIDLIAMYCMFLFINKFKDDQLKNEKPKICGKSKLFFNAKQKNNLFNFQLYFQSFDRDFSKIPIKEYLEANKKTCLPCGHYNAILWLLEAAYAKFRNKEKSGRYFLSMPFKEYKTEKEAENTLVSENRKQERLYKSVEKIFNYVYGVQENNILENKKKEVTREELFKNLIKYFYGKGLLLNICFILDENKTAGRPRKQFIGDYFFNQSVPSDTFLPPSNRVNLQKRIFDIEEDNLPGATLRKKLRLFSEAENVPGSDDNNENKGILNQKEQDFKNNTVDNSLKVQLIKNFFAITKKLKCKKFTEDITNNFLLKVITNNHESNMIIERLLDIINNNTFKDPQFLITLLLNIFQKENSGKKINLLNF